jgi:tellurite resistance protein TerC
MQSELIFISAFVIFIIVALAIDLGLFTSTIKPVSVKQATIKSLLWLILALLFYTLLLTNGQWLHNINTFADLQGLNRQYGHDLKLVPRNFQAGLQQYRNNLSLEFLSGYVMEYALSVDNIFVMLLIFTAFGVSSSHYRKVLSWGIIGAVIMRFCFIFPGAALIARFHWVLYLFGAFLVYTGISMYINRNEEQAVDAENHWVVRMASKYFGVYPQFKGSKFFVRVDGRKMITPLLLVLVIIEFSDLVFAVDSIPAVFSITRDPYIVFFSNIFAIMGLRSLFFLLASMLDKFHYLKTGLAVLFLFIGGRMLAGDWAEKIGLTTGVSLLVIVGVLGSSVGASVLFEKKSKAISRNS